MQEAGELLPHNGNVCYLLQSIASPNKSYIGYTNCLANRIRKHNGEIKGGAKYTKKCRPWRVVAWVSGFQTSVSALKFEWAWKNSHRSIWFRNLLKQAGIDPPSKRIYGPNNRLMIGNRGGGVHWNTLNPCAFWRRHLKK